MDKKLFKYILIIVAAAILMVFALFNTKEISLFLTKLSVILRPVIIGFIFAFILNIPFKKFNKLYGKIPKVNKFKKLVSSLSLITVYILFLAIITAIVLIVIPQLSESIDGFTKNLDTYLSDFESTVNNLLLRITDKIPEDIKLLDYLYNVLEKTPDLVKTIFIGALGFTTSFVNTVIDIVIGLIISVYLLLGKEHLLTQLKKIIYAVFNDKHAKKLSNAIRATNITFSNFISGQLTEAIILGAMCFIGMMIFGFEYKFLISTLIAVTSLLPIIGAFIGTIPSAFILLLIEPMKAVWFVIFIIVLQQIESNLVYPRVVGGKVGLAPLWVLLSILIGGGLFGIIGMLLAVPTMSLIYELTRKTVNTKLSEKGIDIKDSQI